MMRNKNFRNEQPKNNNIVIYGRKPVLEIIRHDSRRIKKIYILDNANLDAELKSFINNFQNAVRKSEDELDILTDSARHQGIVAELNPKPELNLEQLIVKSKNGHGLIVVVDQVKDPHNFGAIMRVAEASGVDGIITTSDKSAPITSATIRASAGAIEFLPIVHIKNLQRTLRELKDSGFWIAGLQKSEDSTDLFETDIPTPTVIVFGSEGKGIRQLTLKECDLLISIKMIGKLESLNVSQAASVCLYELLRRKNT